MYLLIQCKYATDDDGGHHCDDNILANEVVELDELDLNRSESQDSFLLNNQNHNNKKRIKIVFRYFYHGGDNI